MGVRLEELENLALHDGVDHVGHSPSEIGNFGRGLEAEADLDRGRDFAVLRVYLEA